MEPSTNNEFLFYLYDRPEVWELGNVNCPYKATFSETVWYIKNRKHYKTTSEFLKAEQTRIVEMEKISEISQEIYKQPEKYFFIIYLSKKSQSLLFYFLQSHYAVKGTKKIFKLEEQNKYLCVYTNLKKWEVNKKSWKNFDEFLSAINWNMELDRKGKNGKH